MNFTPAELKQILDDHALWLSGTGGKRANLSRADLSGANLSRADLYGANLYGADLSGANLSGANLSGADLYGANLSGADLSGADLSGADLSRAILSRAILSRAILSRAILSGYAQVSFKGHGEIGRMLTAIRQTPDSELYFCCGCFRGSESDLRTYIAEGLEKLRESRTLALETVLKLIAIEPA